MPKLWKALAPPLQNLPRHQIPRIRPRMLYSWQTSQPTLAAMCPLKPALLPSLPHLVCSSKSQAPWQQRLFHKNATRKCFSKLYLPQNHASQESFTRPLHRSLSCTKKATQKQSELHDAVPHTKARTSIKLLDTFPPSQWRASLPFLGFGASACQLEE